MKKEITLLKYVTGKAMPNTFLDSQNLGGCDSFYFYFLFFRLL